MITDSENPTNCLIHAITVAEKPSEVLNELYRNHPDTLKLLLSEVYALFGVPQPAEHHPEICTGIHTGMAMDVAKEIGGQGCAIFALLHDLGKGVTHPSKLPRHFGHENTGVPLVEAVCKRAGYSDRFTRMAVAVCKYHILVHTAYKLTPKRIVHLIRDFRVAARTGCADEEVKSWRGAQIMLKACEADTRGRLGLENRIYHNVAMITQIFNELMTVQEVSKPGYAPSEQDKHHFNTIGRTFKDIKRIRQGTPYFDGNEELQREAAEAWGSHV